MVCSQAQTAFAGGPQLADTFPCSTTGHCCSLCHTDSHVRFSWSGSQGTRTPSCVRVHSLLWYGGDAVSRAFPGGFLPPRCSHVAPDEVDEKENEDEDELFTI